MDAQVINSESARKEVPAANFVPFSSHVTDHIIKLRDGAYLRVWKLAGISFEAADPETISIRHEALNQLMRSIGSGAIACWSHKVRRKVSDRFMWPEDLKGKFPSQYCKEFNDRYFDSFSGYRMMANELYFTVVYKPNYEQGSVANFLSKAVPRTLDEIRDQQNEAIKILNDIAYQVESSMKKYDPEALGAYTLSNQGDKYTKLITKNRPVTYSKALEFYSYLLNGYWERVPLQRQQLNEYLPKSRLFFGNENIEIRTPSDTRFGAVLDFSDYPPHSEPGILNPILYDDYEYIESQSFSMMNKYDALKALERQRNQLISAEDVSKKQIDEIDDARESVVNGEFVMGDYHFSLVIFGESIDRVKQNSAKARSALLDQGFQTQFIDLVPDAAWWAQLPGNWRYRPRAAQITSRAFCGLSAFHNFSAGKRDGNPWGEAVTILKTPSGQPFYANFHVTPEDEDSEDKKALGNTMILGASGEGKTVVELGLICQAAKYGPTVVYYDKDRGAEIAIRRMGGTYLTLKRGQPTGLAPFKLEPTAAVKMLWDAIIKRLVYHETEPLTPMDEAAITQAIESVARMPRNLRSITAIRQFLSNTTPNGLNARLKKWCHGYQFGWVLDNEDDSIDMNSNTLFGFDCTDFLDDPEVRGPVMMYLMHLTESLIDGRRFIYVMAEFWKSIADPYFEDFAKNKQKTIRKQNGFGIFDTQSPSDALESPISRALIEQCATLILLPNPRATKEDYCDGFKLTESEFDIVSSLGEGSRMALFKQGHQSAIVHFDLSGFDEDLITFSGTTDNVELLDQIRAELGTDDPEEWWPVLKERIDIRRALGKRTRKSLTDDALA